MVYNIFFCIFIKGSEIKVNDNVCFIMTIYCSC